MICKRIRMSAGKAPGASIRDLAQYIDAARAGERVLHRGSKGFLTQHLDGHIAEMQALAGAAVRSARPCTHYVVSWREGEQPSPAQADAAVQSFLADLGLDGHQCIYALHGDTKNIHLHMLINRVHPETERIIKINNGFDLEAAHKAVARIEHEQGWERERGGRYASVDGEIVRCSRGEDHDKKISSKAQDFEVRTGAKSAQRTAQETTKEILESAPTWAELHAQLAERGIRLEKKAGGLVAQIGDEWIKASSISRQASLRRLESRLGPYAPAQQREQQQQQQSAPRSIPMMPGLPNWGEYDAARRAHLAGKAAARAEMTQRQEQERAQQATQQKQERAQLAGGDWRGRGAGLNAVRSLLAAQQAAAKIALREQHRMEREQHLREHPPYPDLARWQEMQKDPGAVERWRRRSSSERGEASIGGDTSTADEQPKTRDIRDCSARVVGQEVHYSHTDSLWGAPIFIDHGRQITLRDPRDEGAVLAALQLASQKWGSFPVTGDPEFKLLCTKLAAQHGFKISNPEMQMGIQQERERIKVERTEAMKPNQLKLFEQYAAAVGADRYRVTSMRLFADGGKKAFILDKKEGVSSGFAPDEMTRRIPEMMRLQQRGENLYYTPLSDKKHHILIDDLNRQKLERLIADGYKPAAILESSPGNYQAILTIPKLGTAHDKDIGNRLSDRLNREYGDPKLSGAIHPHRAPGFENRKPKHQREDGTYPEVRLLKAEQRECGKALALATEMATELEQARPSAPQHQPSAPQPSPAPTGPAPTATVRAYRLHREHAGAIVMHKIKKMESEFDLSRLDSMVALRLRMTGHSREAIEAAVAQCAPESRTGEKDKTHHWGDYAKRTASFAFGPAADRQADGLKGYLGLWQRLEGQHPQQQQRAERPREQEQRGMDMGM